MGQTTPKRGRSPQLGNFLFFLQGKRRRDEWCPLDRMGQTTPKRGCDPKLGNLLFFHAKRRKDDCCRLDRMGRTTPEGGGVTHGLGTPVNGTRRWTMKKKITTFPRNRALILSLELGASVLNATDHAELNDECRVALLRATHCAQCRGHTVQARPCRGLCSNVARGSSNPPPNPPPNQLTNHQTHQQTP